jgi:hypothetical protein
MQMPNTLFALLLAAAALYALTAAFRSPAPRARLGWGLVVAAGLGQAANLLTGYSVALSVLSTLALVAGFWMARPRAAA